MTVLQRMIKEKQNSHTIKYWRWGNHRNRQREKAMRLQGDEVANWKDNADTILPIRWKKKWLARKNGI